MKKTKADFNIKNKIIYNWVEGNDIFFYSGLQIVSKNIFQNSKKIFSMNQIWDRLISSRNLTGGILNSKIFHVGDKSSFHKL